MPHGNSVPRNLLDSQCRPRSRTAIQQDLVRTARPPECCRHHRHDLERTLPGALRPEARAWAGARNGVALPIGGRRRSASTRGETTSDWPWVNGIIRSQEDIRFRAEPAQNPPGQFALGVRLIAGTIVEEPLSKRRANTFEQSGPVARGSGTLGRIQLSEIRRTLRSDLRSESRSATSTTGNHFGRLSDNSKGWKGSVVRLEPDRPIRRRSGWAGPQGRCLRIR